MLPTLARALVTPSSTSFSCCAKPFTELTRLGTRSARRWYWFKTSDQLDLTCSSLVWIALRPPWNDDVISPDLPQHRFDRVGLVRRQRGLRGDGVADIVTPDRKPGLDAGCEVVARERFVQAPQTPLQDHRVVPARGLAEIVE